MKKTKNVHTGKYPQNTSTFCEFLWTKIKKTENLDTKDHPQNTSTLTSTTDKNGETDKTFRYKYPCKLSYKHAHFLYKKNFIPR